MKSLNDLIKSLGVQQDNEMGNAFTLHRHACLWFVVQGEVDLFITNVDGASQTEGSLSHVIRRCADELFFSMEPESDVLPFMMLAKSTPDTIVLRVDVNNILMTISGNINYIKNFSIYVDEWIKEICFLLIKEPVPMEEDVVIASSEFTANPRSIVYSPEKILWIKGQQSILNFMDHAISKHYVADLYFPVTKCSWVTVSDIANLTSVMSKDIIISDSFVPSLNKFHLCVYNYFLAQTNINKNEKIKEIKEGKKHKEAVFNDSLNTLGRPLKKSEAYDFSSVVADDDCLYAACRKIGEHLNITFKKPIQQKYKNESIYIDAISRTSNIFKRKVIIERQWWKYDNDAMLGFWKEDRSPVAIIPDRRGHYWVFDFTCKKKYRVNQAIADRLDRFGYVFYRNFSNDKLSLKSIFKFSFHRLQHEGVKLVLLSLIGGLLALAVPVVTGKIIDVVIPNADISLLIQYALGLGAIVFASLIFQLSHAIILIHMQNKIELGLEAAIWDRLIKLPTRFHAKFTVGDLVDRATGINTIQSILTGIAINTVLSSIFSIFSFILLFYYSAELAFISTGIVLILFVITICFSLVLLNYQRKIFFITGKIDGILRQIIDGMSKIRVAGAEAYVFHYWSKMFARVVKNKYKAGKINAINQSINITYSVVALVFIYAAVTYHLDPTSFTIGDFLAFNAAYGAFLGAMFGFVSTFVSVLAIIPLYERITPIIHAEPEVNVTMKEPGQLTGKLELDAISFHYGDSGPQVLSNVSLHANPGEMIAIVGGSGAGKSTILRIMLGFDIPQKGMIYYDDHDLHELDLRLVRHQLGVVLQNDKLLPDSIFKNIIGDSNLTVDAAWDAVKACGMYDDIKSMPMGMHTIISESGGGLSGGQYQKLLLSRAIVHNPKILFLDEATSALDNCSQAVVIDNLKKLNATRVVIAHRLNTIQHADRIYVLSKGKLIETGNFAELMENKGFFARMAARQLS